jgi:hypothetical protein
MKNRLRPIVVLLVLLSYVTMTLSGCAAKYVLERRQEREARVKEKTNFWSLSAVTSAQIVSGTEVFACVELRDSPSDTPEAFTINLSQAQRIGRTFRHFMPAGYVPSGPAEEPVWYLYPLQEALKGCVRATGERPFPVAELKVETLRIDRSVFMAAQLPDKKDLNVLKPGVPRSVVIAEMGAPSSYDELEGTRTEVYKFKQGYSTPNKISRAVFHGTADLFTWGLWEVVATPTEYCFSGTDTIVMVAYDGSNRVEKVQYVKGGE